MALPHRRLGQRARLECGQVLGTLTVERDLDESRQAESQSFGGQQRDPPFDDARLDEPLDAAQARCGRKPEVSRQGVVRQRRVPLQMVEDPQIGGVKRDWIYRC